MEPSNIVGNLPIWVFDHALPTYEHDAMYEYCLNSLYTPRQLSDAKTESAADARFAAVLTPEQVGVLPTTRLFNELMRGIDVSSEISKVYINCYDKMSKCAAHIDSASPAYTMLYYANTKWDIDWGGETLFFNQEGDIAFGSALKPNRAVVFDSRILHIAKTPSAAAPTFKFSIAYKGGNLA